MNTNLLKDLRELLLLVPPPPQQPPQTSASWPGSTLPYEGSLEPRDWPRRGDFSQRMTEASG